MPTNISVNIGLPEMNTRIRELIDHYAGGNVAKFAESLGPEISQQRLNRLFNLERRGKEAKYPSVPEDVIVGIAKRYKEVNATWLLTGSGNMHLSEQRNTGATIQASLIPANLAELKDYHLINHALLQSLVQQVVKIRAAVDQVPLSEVAKEMGNTYFSVLQNEKLTDIQL